MSCNHVVIMSYHVIRSSWSAVFNIGKATGYHCILRGLDTNFDHIFTKIAKSVGLSLSPSIFGAKFT
jgi:hypothetical protein